MKLNLIAIIAFTVLVAALGACRSSEPTESKVIQRASASVPTLTSTTAPPAVLEDEPTLPSPAIAEPTPTKVEVDVEETKLPSPDVFEPEVESLDGLTLARFVTASGTEKREPTAASSSFVSGEERVYAFIEAKNDSDLPRLLMVHFIGPDDEVSGGVELEVPASVARWRTWAYTRHAKSPGLWRVEIRDEDGTLVGALPFEVEP